jgi:uncharacterized protein YjiS (DUF1127 family)
MEGSSTLVRRMPTHAGYAIIDAVFELVAAARRPVAAALARAAEAKRQAIARRELRQLSDHALRDIGLDRADIEGMFR